MTDGWVGRMVREAVMKIIESALLLIFSLSGPANALSPVGTTGIYTAATDEYPAQTVYLPAEKGPIVIVLSGADGPRLYDSISSSLGKAGYYSVLLSSRDVPSSPRGDAIFKRVIERAQKEPQAAPGKVGVVGLSLGGSVALFRASRMANQVAAVVVYYPRTSEVTDARGLAQSFRVPVLMLAGERDTHNNCCLIRTARAIEAAAKEVSAPFTLIVYPKAKHAFNIEASPAYSGSEDRDAWERTLEMLKKHLRSE